MSWSPPRNSSQDTVGTSPPWRFSVTVAIGAAGLAVEFIDTYAAQAAEAGTGIDITLSALDLAEIAQLEEALDELANVLAEADPSVIAAFAAARQPLRVRRQPRSVPRRQPPGSRLADGGVSGDGHPVRPEIEAVLTALRRL